MKTTCYTKTSKITFAIFLFISKLILAHTTNFHPALKTNITAAPTVWLILDGENGSQDMTAVYFGQGGSFNFQTNFDAYKMIFDPLQPYIATVSDSIICSIKGLPVLNTNMSIPVKAITAATGNFTFSLLQSNFPDNVCVGLFDAFTGITTNIVNTNYTCTLYDTTTTTRFTLSFFTTTLPATSTIMQPTCTEQTAMLTSIGANSGPWNYEWKNSNNVTVKTSLNKSTADSLTVLPGGNYTVKINTIGQCLNYAQTFTINTISIPIADFSVNNYTTVLSNFNPLNFTNLSSNAQTFIWDFGDGLGNSTLNNPSYNYSMGGTYPVKLIVQSNSMCFDTIVKQLTVLNPTSIQHYGINDPFLLQYDNVTGNYILRADHPSETTFLITLYDAGGKLIFSKNSGNSLQHLIIDMQWFTKGIYLLKVTSNEKNIQTFKLIK